MAFISLEPSNWRRKFSRTLVIGPPNSWKTSALVTWPKPIAIVVYPGELGSSSIPVNVEGVKAFVWEHDPVTKVSPGAMLREVDQLTVDILSGKHGEFRTFAGDGLHKLYKLIYDDELAQLEDSSVDADPEKLGGRAFGRAHVTFLKKIQRVSESTVDYVVMTAWSSMEKDDPEAKKSPKHTFPDFPGKMGQDVLGEFGGVVYSIPGKEISPGKFGKGQWQTRRHGDVWGVGLKLPQDVAAKVPTFVDQDWAALEKMVGVSR